MYDRFRQRNGVRRRKELGVLGDLELGQVGLRRLLEGRLDHSALNRSKTRVEVVYTADKLMVRFFKSQVKLIFRILLLKVGHCRSLKILVLRVVLLALGEDGMPLHVYLLQGSDALL